VVALFQLVTGQARDAKEPSMASFGRSALGPAPSGQDGWRQEFPSIREVAGGVEKAAAGH